MELLSRGNYWKKLHKRSAKEPFGQNTTVFEMFELCSLTVNGSDLSLLYVHGGRKLFSALQW